MLVLVRRIYLVLLLFLTCIALSAPAAQFKVGFAQSGITPTNPMPMRGCGARRNALSEGVRDPLFAKAVVIDAGEEKAAHPTLTNSRFRQRALGKTPRALLYYAHQPAPFSRNLKIHNVFHSSNTADPRLCRHPLRHIQQTTYNDARTFMRDLRHLPGKYVKVS